jgi:hypothetical protein
MIDLILMKKKKCMPLGFKSQFFFNLIRLIMDLRKKNGLTLSFIFGRSAIPLLGVQIQF